MKFFADKLLEQRVVLIRAPPASGKTSLTQLLYLHLFEFYQDVLPILINCLKSDKSKRFEEQFANKSGLGMNMDEVRRKASCTDNR